MRKLAIFDLDGTLLNTLDDIAGACNYALRTCGYPPHPHDAYKLFVGSGVHNLIKRAIAPVENTATTEQVEAVFRTYYRKHAQDETRPYPGIPELLRGLREKGIELAVLSNKPHEDVKELVARYFPGLLSLALGQREGVKIKPDPAALFEILRICACTADDAVYIGDSGVDMQTGRSAGLYTIGVTWGFRTKDTLLKHGADVLVDESAQLHKIIIDKLLLAGYTK